MLGPGETRCSGQAGDSSVPSPPPGLGINITTEPRLCPPEHLSYFPTERNRDGWVLLQQLLGPSLPLLQHFACFTTLCMLPPGPSRVKVTEF